MSKKINVLFFEVDKLPRLIEIDNTLRAMQELVGGYIEVARKFDDGAVVVCNEEGIIRHLKLNRCLDKDQKDMSYYDRLQSCIFGNFFICEENGVDFDSLGLEKVSKYEVKYFYPIRSEEWNTQNS